jgi:hypothetical protein
MSREREGLVQSLQVRLARHAKEIGVDPNLVLTRFAVERFLYRLSKSRHVDRFVLKGALLLLVWLGETLRPTRDADVLGFGDLSNESLEGVFADVCAVAVEPDGMTYHADTIRVADIRPEDAYGGKRVTLRAHLGAARLRVQVDVGIGDAVDPGPEWLDYPSLLDLPSPRLLSYPPEVVVAEKLHAMVVLGSKNSRMRDFFDIHALARGRAFEGRRLVRALHSTFARRKTPLPADLPIALTPDFADIEGKRSQWEAFLAKNRIVPPAADLDSVVSALAAFLQPPLDAARDEKAFDLSWPAGGLWR